MIDSLRGELLDKLPGQVVVDCMGVGYLVHVPLSIQEALPTKGPVRLHVHYQVSVDVRSGQSEHRLFGFLRPDERALFRSLIGVQGVSATLGLAILGARSADEVRMAALSGDEALFQGIKGIGPKLAQRIVADLAGRLGAAHAEVLPTGGGPGNSLKAEALSALISLGLDRVKAERALQGVMKEHQGAPPPLEELIKMTLKNL
ncbi:MAG: Holliday junction branch migration protein RuvA [Flavobacteriales bacterium]|nr:Holliday junction branch migration protein RuvA [Flavobacteriales bacterium]MCB9193148.1 Holliday junction branch migration protein RuvA [Flavobacteriales bacterium]